MSWGSFSQDFNRALEQFERDQRERKAQKYKKQMEKAMAGRKKRGDKNRPET